MYYSLKEPDMTSKERLAEVYLNDPQPNHTTAVKVRLIDLYNESYTILVQSYLGLITPACMKWFEYTEEGYAQALKEYEKIIINDSFTLKQDLVDNNEFVFIPQRH